MQYLQNIPAQTALRYAVGIALMFAVLVGSALPALAGINASATCDGWHVDLDGYPDGNYTVTIILDFEVLMDSVPFENGFNLGQGKWQGYQDSHVLEVLVYLDGGFVAVETPSANGCPTSPPVTINAEATCDGWSFLFDDFDHSLGTWTYELGIDGSLIVQHDPVVNGFSRAGPWTLYVDDHRIAVYVYLDAQFFDLTNTQASGCPTSPPTTTTTLPPTTTTTTTTTTTKTPTPQLPPPNTVPAVTTTTVPLSSTTTTLTTTTTLAPSTTVGDVEAEAPDKTLVAAADTEPPSGSNTAPLLIGLLAGLAIAGAVGGAWYLGKRSTQN